MTWYTLKKHYRSGEPARLVQQRGKLGLFEFRRTSSLDEWGQFARCWHPLKQAKEIPPPVQDFEYTRAVIQYNHTRTPKEIME